MLQEQDLVLVLVCQRSFAGIDSPSDQLLLHSTEQVLHIHLVPVLDWGKRAADLAVGTTALVVENPPFQE
jgi:hypothetical protein